MEALLPYYERELGFLRRHAREFADKYPRIAGRLQLGGEVCDDPHTERMIQSVALLNARIAKRLDDDYPQFTEALFDVLYPHYLQPFPSCSIACFGAQGSTVSVLARGAEFNSRKVNGVACTFRTAYPVTLAPLAVQRAQFSPIMALPEHAREQGAGGAGISITLASTTAGALAGLGLGKVRLFVDAEASFCAALRDALFLRTVGAYVQGEAHGRWHALDTQAVTPAGFADEDALIELPARSHPAYRLLTEYFCFPEKFNFFDIDLAALCAVLPPQARSATLHLSLSGLRSDSSGARILGTLAPSQLRLGCTPVVNLFRRHAEPTRLTHAQASYPLSVGAGCVVHALEKVQLTRQNALGDAQVEFRPFYALRHARGADNSGHYWVLRRRDGVPGRQADAQTELALVDIDFDPAEVDAQTLSVDALCSNGDLPSTLGCGQPGGDLFGERGAVVSIALLRKPTPGYRFECGNGGHWRLISHLALNHLSLADGGVDALREMLTLYDLPRAPASARQIDGIKAVEHRAATTWLAGNPYACLVRGTEVRLTIDEEAFVGSGIGTFAHVFERFLGLYAHANSFTQLTIVSEKSGEALLTLKPRSGDLSLL